ncbi:MAG: hypothetical protein ACLSE6_04960 [Alphaproteobacteria bacterium]
MSYIFWGFLFGVLIPYMARRFAKFMPATPRMPLSFAVAGQDGFR